MAVFDVKISKGWRGALLAAAWLLACAGAQAAICRVAPAGTAGNDGTSWGVPKSLANALSSTGCTEIWLAPGIYSGSFTIARNLVLRGGFEGSEMAASDRATPIDPALAVLDGGGTQRVLTIDGTTGSSNASSITAATVIEGLTIRNGKASWGGGVYCNASLYSTNPNNNQRTCSPVFQRVRFTGNSATYGGALYLDAASNQYGTASPQLTDVVFDGNTATSLGGAIYNWANLYGKANPVITNATFSGNSAVNGGAIYNTSGSQGSTQASPVITNATFVGNAIAIAASGVNGGGAIYNYGANGTNAMRLTNVTFSGNQALGDNHFGGAIYNFGGNAKPVIVNAIFWGNEASSATANDFYGATGTQITASIVQGGCPGGATCTGVTTGDPHLAAPADNGGLGQTMLPAIPGPAIDTGDAAACPATDQRGITRPQGSGCDIGAVEIEQAPQYTLTVAVTGGGSVSGGAISGCTAGGGTCSASYTTADSVGLTATPDTGQHFSAWGGDCSGSGACSVTMNASHGVTALFEPDSYAVTASAGSGGGLLCADASLAYGQATTCTAVPTTGYTTQSISGCGGTPTGAGVNEYATGAVTGACTVTATFQKSRYAIEASASPTDAGTLQCPASVEHGDSATCTASAPAHGYSFTGFTGCDEVSGSTCTLTNVTGARSVTAQYAAIAHPANVPVPALHAWALAALGLLAAGLGARRLRRGR